MSSLDDHVATYEDRIGLNRASIDAQGRIKLPQEGRFTPAVQSEPDHTHTSKTHNFIDSLVEKRHHAATKIRKTLHASKVSDNIKPNERVILADDSDKSRSKRLSHDLPEPETIKFRDILHDPVSSVVSKISGQVNEQLAANVSAKEVSHGHEVEMVNVNSEVEGAKTAEERLLAVDDLHRLMAERQSILARWTLDRHVTKVRPMPRNIPTPTRADFEKQTADEGIVIDWQRYAQQLVVYWAHVYGGQYVGAGTDFPTPSKETIMPSVERLLIASAPLQEFIMRTRQIYRYEDPAKTLRYLLIYFTLWYFNLLLSSTISVLIYLIVERHVNSPNLKNLRQDIVHRENMEKIALSLSDHIIKRGDEQWADELLQRVGPWLMIQLADLANFFESAQNFYEWRVPHRTARTLIMLGLAIPMTILIPPWLLLKSMTFGAGFVFFGLVPIASNFPEYRLLVSLLKRFLWSIPTHAEWAIKYVQAKGIRAKEHANTAQAATSGSELDYGSYSARENKVLGRLIIHSTSIHFVSKMSETFWVLLHADIERFEKQNRLSKGVPSKLQRDSGMDLRFVMKGGEEKLLKDVQERDEVFAQILGLSDIDWQVLW